jgi:hypothetical protein
MLAYRREARMKKRVPVLFAVGVLLTSFGLAKDKSKATLPTFVLQARTVAVLIDPEAGVSVQDPKANETAQRDVESALLEWGRLEPVLSTRNADLIIVIRRGHGRNVVPTISDPRQNNRAGSVVPFSNGASIGGQRGRPGQQDPVVAGPTDDSAHPQVEVGGADDSFAVYRGRGDEPLNAADNSAINTPPVWRYVAKDGLLPHSVPAVSAFRKAMAVADKAEADREAAKKAQKGP